MFVHPRKKVKISEKRCEPFPVGLIFKLYINLAKKKKKKKLYIVLDIQNKRKG